MALLVARVMLEPFCVHPVGSWTKNADAGTASKSERHVRRTRGAILFNIYPYIRVEYL